MELHFYEIPKFRKKPIKELTRAERWLAYFASQLDEQEAEEIFPDLPDCFTDGQTPEEALENAADALNLFLWHYEKNKRTIPEPRSITTLKVPQNGFISMIKADTLAYARENDTRSVRKNLSIPHWLNVLAIENNINFSNLLQKALMQELNVSKR